MPFLVSGLQATVQAAMLPHPGLAPAVLVNTLVYAAGIKILLKGLTMAGVAHSWVLGTLSYAAFGCGGYALVCAYFVVGTLATRLKLKQKQEEGIAEARSGRRGPASVYGSAIAAMCCACVALATHNHALFTVGYVANFCSKLSDTLSSEVGKAYGQTTYLITNFKLVPRGTEGAISLEGTLAGVASAMLFATLAVSLGVVDASGAGAAAAAAVAANLFESWLGATVQGHVAWLTNDVVNMIQVTLAAGVAMVLHAYALPALRHGAAASLGAL